MTRSIICILIAMIFFGCTMASKGYRPDYYVNKAGDKVDITDPAEQCVLYRVIGVDTEYYKVGLFTANYAALKTGIYTPEEADKELDFIEKSVDSEVATVGSVINSLLIVAGEAGEAGLRAAGETSEVGAPEIILVAEGLEVYIDDPTPIDECTWYKLKTYIAKQRVLVHAFKNGE